MASVASPVIVPIYASQDELRAAFVKHPSLRSAMGKQIAA